MATTDEHVLVLPKERFQQAGQFTGFRPFDQSYFLHLIDPSGLTFRPRSEMETNPGFKQLIPYIILRHQETIFEYVRGSSSGETRLHHRRSIGIGGHISADDQLGDVYRTGMLRELHEELTIASEFSERLLGFIYDPRTPVGEVHLGIVHVLDLKNANVSANETGIAAGKFTVISELLDRLDEFETWSQFALEAFQNENG